jgi:hypothetical protein
MDAEQIIHRMQEAYRKFETYQDSGYVDGYPGRVKFRTLFRRPQNFLFEWTYLDEPNKGRNIIWTEGPKTFAIHDYEAETEELESLDLAIAGGTGVSVGTSHAISTLLMPELRVSRDSRTVPKRAPFSIKDSELVEGRECFILISADDPDDTLSIWICKTDLVITKWVEQQYQSPEKDAQMLAHLAAVDPSMVEEMQALVDNQTEEDRWSTTTAVYGTVNLNQVIPMEAFKP